MHQFQNSYEIKLRYGLRDEHIVDINDLSQDEKGLMCRCVCPNCKTELVAKLGNKNQRHFAHKSAECDIKIANQTALHILAKEIIEKYKQFTFPALTVNIEDTEFTELQYEYMYDVYDKYDIHIDVPPDLEYKKAIRTSCDKVVLERRITDFVPDVLIFSKGKECIIEIAVTHFIHDEKLEKMKKVGLPVVEIDLSEFKGEELSYQKLKNIIVNGTKYKKWIYNPRTQEAINWANIEYEKINQKIEVEATTKSKKILAQKEKKERNKILREQKIANLFLVENYKKELENLRNDNETINVYRNTAMYQVYKRIPFYMNLPVFGEVIFKCDRRIWQSKIFEKFIFNRNSNNSTINIKRIESWILKHQKIFEIDWSLMGKINSAQTNNFATSSLLYDCLKQYLYYLILLGFVEETYKDEKIVVQTREIKPPNTENMKFLREALRKVDVWSIDVNSEIKNSIREKQWIKQYEEELAKKYEYEKIKQQKLKDEYKKRYDEVVDKFDDENIKIVRDSTGARWFKCTECCKIFRDEEMVYTELKIGTCRPCSRLV